MLRLVALAMLLAATTTHAQDIRGLENCSAEKQMERRTGCLQANTEFLHQALQKLTREMQQKQAASAAEIAALREALAVSQKEIAVLKEALGKAQAEAEKAKKNGE